jgi:hypothetical protein
MDVTAHFVRWRIWIGGETVRSDGVVRAAGIVGSVNAVATRQQRADEPCGANQTSRGERSDRGHDCTAFRFVLVGDGWFNDRRYLVCFPFTSKIASWKRCGFGEMSCPNQSLTTNEPTTIDFTRSRLMMGFRKGFFAFSKGHAVDDDDDACQTERVWGKLFSCERK